MHPFLVEEVHSIYMFTCKPLGNYNIDKICYFIKTLSKATVITLKRLYYGHLRGLVYYSSSVAITIYSKNIIDLLLYTVVIFNIFTQFSTFSIDSLRFRYENIESNNY